MVGRAPKSPIEVRRSIKNTKATGPAIAIQIHFMNFLPGLLGVVFLGVK